MIDSNIDSPISRKRSFGLTERLRRRVRIKAIWKSDSFIDFDKNKKLIGFMITWNKQAPLEED